jgi:hypothetical protein
MRLQVLSAARFLCGFSAGHLLCISAGHLLCISAGHLLCFSAGHLLCFSAAPVLIGAANCRHSLAQLLQPPSRPPNSVALLMTIVYNCDAKQ